MTGEPLGRTIDGVGHYIAMEAADKLAKVLIAS